MNNIDKLIKELCPNGVEYKELGEICDFQNGFAFKSSLFENKGLPILRITNIKDKFIDEKSLKYFDEKNYKTDLTQFKVINGDILIAMSGATTGKIGQVKDNQEFYINQRVGKFEPKSKILVNNYLFHFLLTKLNFLHNLGGGGAQPNLSSNKLMKSLKIPLPHIKIQTKIVEILDNFTDLDTNLKQELENRKKQYEHYREQLLCFDNSVEITTLDKISKNLDSKRKPVTRSARDKGKYPYYGASGIVDYVSDYIFDGNYLLISEDGANLLVRKTPIAFPATGKTWVNNHAHILEFDELISQRFIEIYLNSIDLTPYITGAAQPKLNKTNMNTIKIPFPKFEIRKDIVSKIDQFDKLINNLQNEIKLRHKQYESYREMLLNFKRLN